MASKVTEVPEQILLAVSVTETEGVTAVVRFTVIWSFTVPSEAKETSMTSLLLSVDVA